MNIHTYMSALPSRQKPIKWSWWKQWVHCRISSYAKRDKAHTRKFGLVPLEEVRHSIVHIPSSKAIYLWKKAGCLFVCLSCWDLSNHCGPLALLLVLLESPWRLSWFHYVYVSTYSGKVIEFLIKFSLKIHLNQKKKKNYREIWVHSWYSWKAINE